MIIKKCIHYIDAYAFCFDEYFLQPNFILYNKYLLYSIEWVKEKDEHYAKDLERSFPNYRELLFFFIIIQISAILRYIRIKRHSKITSFVSKKNSVLQPYKTQSDTEINKC